MALKKMDKSLVLWYNNLLADGRLKTLKGFMMFSVKRLMVTLGLVLSVTTIGNVSYAKDDKGLLLENSNTVVLRGEIDGKSTSETLMALSAIKGDNVNLFISSPGGSVIDGINFISAVKGLNKHITCITDFAASMAFVILQACDERVVLDSSIIMQHVPSMGAQGQYPNFKSFVGLLDRVTETIYDNQAKRLGISVEDFRKKIRDDYWLLGKDAVTAKAADRVSNVSCSQDLLDKRVGQDITVFIFKLSVVWSGCPLINYPLAIGAPTGGRMFVDSKMYQTELNRILNFRNNMVNNMSDYQYDFFGKRVQGNEQDLPQD